MRSTFNLKEPKKDGKTSIRLIAYFKDENKRFVYSTGESINPINWDFENLQPKHLKGRSKLSQELNAIKYQLDRYSNLFMELVNRYKVLKEDFTTEVARKEFDNHFTKTKPLSRHFFDVYDLFIKEKETNKSSNTISATTIQRYGYNKTLLMNFEEHRKSQIQFKTINEVFYSDLVNYCVEVKKHSTNTLSRNIGLFKSFMYWALENNYTYNDQFKKFKNIKKVITEEIALTLDQVKELADFDFNENKRLERVRDLFVFGCATGMRYSNYSAVEKSDVYNNQIHIRDKKNTDKLISIPLNDFSKAILEKYNYQLPVLANQKFNDYIKEVFEKLGYTQEVKKTSKIGNTVVEKTMPLYKRISSHTARRSFITIMKNKKIPDKVIMSYTGHRSLEIFNKYYKPNTEDKVDFMNSVWNK